MFVFTYRKKREKREKKERKKREKKENGVVSVLVSVLVTKITIR
jgi:hypothetical protein